jgi:hypothetical protein
MRKARQFFQLSFQEGTGFAGTLTRVRSISSVPPQTPNPGRKINVAALRARAFESVIVRKDYLAEKKAPELVSSHGRLL